MTQKTQSQRSVTGEGRRRRSPPRGCPVTRSPSHPFRPTPAPAGCSSGQQLSSSGPDVFAPIITFFTGVIEIAPCQARTSQSALEKYQADHVTPLLASWCHSTLGPSAIPAFLSSSGSPPIPGRTCLRGWPRLGVSAFALPLSWSFPPRSSWGGRLLDFPDPARCHLLRGRSLS